MRRGSAARVPVDNLLRGLGKGFCSMTEQLRLNRGRFLKLSAMAAIGTAVTAAVGDMAAPAAEAQMAYNEAPMLAAQVAAGQLPPVQQRLPDNPYIPPHQWLGTGQYGGMIRLAFREP